MDLVRIGFDGSVGGAGSADLGDFITRNGSMLKTTNVFRIEGTYVCTITATLT